MNAQTLGILALLLAVKYEVMGSTEIKCQDHFLYLLRKRKHARRFEAESLNTQGWISNAANAVRDYRAIDRIMYKQAEIVNDSM